MVHRNRVAISTTVSKNTLAIVHEAAIRKDCTVSRALDEIVQEWQDSRIIKPFDSNLEDTNLSDLGITTDKVNILLDDLHMKLKKMRIRDLSQG